jgi:DNA polymerase III subunit alpha
VRDALNARVDCTLGELARKPDGAWVTVGGIVAGCKRVRTKSGTQMLFATLDDVEDQVEMLVFKADQTDSAAVIVPDAVVLVRGRIDHKDRGETKLVVQEAERFEPGQEELARAGAAQAAPAEPVKVTLAAANLGNPHLLDELKTVIAHHRGEAEVHLAIVGASGKEGEWKLGREFRVRPSRKLLAELDNVLGADSLAA